MVYILSEYQCTCTRVPTSAVSWLVPARPRAEGGMAAAACDVSKPKPEPNLTLTSAALRLVRFFQPQNAELASEFGAATLDLKRESDDRKAALP